MLKGAEQIGLAESHATLVVPPFQHVVVLEAPGLL